MLATSDPAGALVIVDVLSFSTSLTVAVGRDIAVYPHPWPDPGAATVAADHDAVLAVRRHEVSAEHSWSLSPSHLIAAPATERPVLPSPNGSTIAAAARARRVLAGCLRNATAVGHWLRAHDFGTPARPAVIIAAGERWPDGQQRPALEDLLGAGAVIALLADGADVSPEAAAEAA